MEFISNDPILEFLPDTLVSIRKLYNLDDGRMAQSVAILEEWVKKQQHFQNKKFTRVYLERTIISCKGSVEKAKSQIDKLCTIRTLLPKFFLSSDVKKTFSNIENFAYVLPLPKMTNEYERIFLLKLNDKDVTAEHIVDYYKLSIVISEYIKAHDYFNGVVIVEDFRDVNLMGLITKLNLIEVQQFVTILTECFGARLKGIHIITQSKVVDLLVKTLKSVMPPKLGNRLYVHPDLEGLHQVIDTNLLPLELGGKERSIKELQDAWIDILSSAEHEDYLAQMKSFTTDESLRQTDKFNEQYMGLPGSFRTLTVD